MPRDIIILHLCSLNDNHMIYGSWDMKHNRLNFLSFWTIFCPFTSLKTWKIKILKKWKQQKKMLGDIIILYMCTINENHMMYGSWDMEYDRPFFFSFWTILCLFTPLTSQKIKILKKEKKHLEISFYTSVPKIMMIYYTFP